MTEFSGRKVTVMGIGLHGGAIETIKWLLKRGAYVIATDIGKKEYLMPSLEKLKGLKNLEIVVGQHRPEDFSRVDMVVKNPAVSWENKYIKLAKNKKIPIETDASLFFKYCQSDKTIGVTGTKGKTTTSLLIYEILKKAGKKVVKVGVGQEPVMDKLNEIDEDTYVVFELSSWRLSGLIGINKKILVSVITNIYPDHLNYYRIMDEYIRDKKIILDLQDEQGFCVINIDDKYSTELALTARARKIFFSLDQIDCRDCIYLKEGQVVLDRDGLKEDIVSAGLLKLRGHHNTYNLLAAVGVATVLKIKSNFIEEALLGYKGASHRLEFIREIKGVRFYNDSAATMPEAAIAGINAFLKPIHLICGGSSKNLDLSKFALKAAESKYVKNIYLLEGDATIDLEKKIIENGGSDKIKGIYKSIELAVGEAFREAQKGEMILLSPACASFGMFKNEFDRGNKFKKAVEQL
jgi:UDP-N-acetylmuramoylalanine--D-glutamate ligase